MGSVIGMELRAHSTQEWLLVSRMYRQGIKAKWLEKAGVVWLQSTCSHKAISFCVCSSNWQRRGRPSIKVICYSTVNKFYLKVWTTVYLQGRSKTSVHQKSTTKYQMMNKVYSTFRNEKKKNFRPYTLIRIL